MSILGENGSKCLGRQLRLGMSRRTTENKPRKLKFGGNSLIWPGHHCHGKVKVEKMLQLLEANLVMTGREPRDLVIRSYDHIRRK